jgi:predicted transcriptional regulator
MKTLEQAIDNLSETMKEASEMIKSLREENKKQKDALNYVKQWLNETIDEGSSDTIEEDSANLLHNMKLILEE